MSTMRLVYLTAGAGGMYCGSCLRDNTVARHLSRLGVDVQLVPLYTPIRTDEPDVSRPQVFFGGINLYLRQKSRIFRTIPTWATRWLDSPRLLRWAASGKIETDARQLGELTLAMLAGKHGPLHREVDELVQWLQHEKPHLLNLSNLLIAGSLPELKRRLGVPVVVTLQGDDLFLDQLPSDYRDQAVTRLRQLAVDVDRFVVFSRFYQQKMSDLLEVEPARFELVPLGVDVSDLRELNRGPRPERPITVGFLARAAPEKGLHVLVEAFLKLKRTKGLEHTRLVVAGWNSRPQNPYVQQQIEILQAARAADSVQWRGEVDREGKRVFFESIDVLCVPLPYAEPKGMFALEALAAGVPVIVPSHGVFPEMFEGVQGAWMIAAADGESAWAELAQRLGQPTELRGFGELGRSWVEQRRTAQVMAQATLDVYHRLLETR